MTFESVITEIGLTLHNLLNGVRVGITSFLPEVVVSIVFLVISLGIVGLIQFYGEGKIKWTIVLWTIILFLLLRFI